MPKTEAAPLGGGWRRRWGVLDARCGFEFVEPRNTYHLMVARLD